MKKLFIALMAMLAVNTAAWAQGVAKPTGLVLTLKNTPVQQVLFTDAPVLTHSEDCTQITISGNGFEAVTFDVADVEEMTFAYIDRTITGIEKLVQNDDINARQGVYDLNGLRVNSIQKGKVYIVNGKRVMIK